jgi:molecular chaperone Hsp33
MHRFLFDHTDIRGEVVPLTDSYRQVIDNNQHLPESVQQVLGEFVAAVSLLSSTLKFEGIITLQARGEGALSLIMAECSYHSAVRGIAQVNDDVPAAAIDTRNLRELLGKGVIAITIDPTKGERYQGIVPLEGDNLADCLAQYFAQSEQLATRFWFAAGAENVTGLMLQALPIQIASAEDNQDHWDTAIQLANTVKDEELLTLEHSQLLYRLFNEESVRLFEPCAIHFECSCSRERSGNSLAALGREEFEQLLEQQILVNIDCQFCNNSYTFSAKDLELLFGHKDRPLH